jgi:hypothetical protein
VERMTEFFGSPHLVDLILAIVAGEALAIVLYWQLSRRGIAPRLLLPNVLAGVFLLLALRLALSGLSWPWYAACLAASGIANVADLRQRWR